MSEVTSVKTDVDVEVLKKIPKNELGLDYFVSFDFAQFDANLENFLKGRKQVRYSGNFFVSDQYVWIFYR